MSERSPNPTNERPTVFPHEMRDYDERHAAEISGEPSENGRAIETEPASTEIDPAECERAKIYNLFRAENERDRAISQEQDANRSQYLLVEAYRSCLAQKVPGDEKGRNYADLIALHVVRKAARGDLKSAIEVADRIGGKTLPALPYVKPPVRLPAQLTNFALLEFGELLVMSRLLLNARVIPEGDEIFRGNIEREKAELDARISEDARLTAEIEKRMVRGPRS